jgi:putative endonuclease
MVIYGQPERTITVLYGELMLMPYYVYIILCEGNRFYTGYTKNLKSRLRLHMNGKAARYTRIHMPKRLVYVKEFSSIREAMKTERRIKKLNHRQKLELTKRRVKRALHPRKRESRQDSAQM